MPFLRPGLTERRAEVMNDLMSAPGGDGMGLLRRAVSTVLAWVIANVAYTHDEHLDWIARMSVPWSAEDEYLEAWAAVPDVTRKLPTAFTCSWIGSGQTAAAGQATPVLPAGTMLTRDDGATYATTADAAVAVSGVVTAPIAATLAGSAGTCEVGTVLTLAGSVAGIAAQGAVGTDGVAGTDAELDDSLKTRMLARWASPPQGGAASDYITWTLAVPGVTRAWVLPLGMGPGTVVTYFMMDDARATATPITSGFPTGTNGVAATETRDVPATGDQLAVANAIYPLRPVTALDYVVAPTPYPVAFNIHAAGGGVPVALQPQINAAIDSVFLVYGSALSIEIEAAPFNTAIAAVPGMPAFTLTLPPILAPVGALPVRGAVTYA